MQAACSVAMCIYFDCMPCPDSTPLYSTTQSQLAGREPQQDMNTWKRFLIIIRHSPYSIFCTLSFNNASEALSVKATTHHHHVSMSHAALSPGLPMFFNVARRKIDEKGLVDFHDVMDMVQDDEHWNAYKDNNILLYRASQLPPGPDTHVTTNYVHYFTKINQASRFFCVHIEKYREAWLRGQSHTCK